MYVTHVQRHVCYTMIFNAYNTLMRSLFICNIHMFYINRKQGTTRWHMQWEKAGTGSQAVSEREMGQNQANDQKKKRWFQSEGRSLGKIGARLHRAVARVRSLPKRSGGHQWMLRVKSLTVVEITWLINDRGGTEPQEEKKTDHVKRD